MKLLWCLLYIFWIFFYFSLLPSLPLPLPSFPFHFLHTVNVQFSPVILIYVCITVLEYVEFPRVHLHLIIYIYFKKSYVKPAYCVLSDYEDTVTRGSQTGWINLWCLFSIVSHSPSPCRGFFFFFAAF